MLLLRMRRGKGSVVGKFVTLVLILVHVAAVVDGACFRKGFNKRSPSDVIETFDKLVDEMFVGQDKAVRAVRRELVERFNLEHDEPLFLHFVGPTGTGKSYLAELVAKSLFMPVDCRPESKLDNTLENWQMVGAGTVATAVITTAVAIANPLVPILGFLTAGAGIAASSKTALEHTCAMPTSLQSWEQMCGVYEGRFKPYVNDEMLQQTMEGILTNAALELRFQPSSVIIFDEFQYCAGRDCERLLKGVLGRKTLFTEKQEPVSCRDAVFILTSDLSEFGVELLPGSTYEEALEQVVSAASEHWGKDSMILNTPVVIPFAPLSHSELVLIVNKMIDRFKTTVASRVVRAVSEVTKDSEPKVRSTWAGKVYCSEDVKEAIVDRLHEQSLVKNARAITEDLKNILRIATRTPTPIEERIMEVGPKASKGGGRLYDASVELVVQQESNGKWLQLEIVQ